MVDVKLICIDKGVVPAAFADHENQIQTIQKNVRMWLLRRQYLDILEATKVLQHRRIFEILLMF